MNTDRARIILLSAGLALAWFTMTGCEHDDSDSDDQPSEEQTEQDGQPRSRIVYTAGHERGFFPGDGIDFDGDGQNELTVGGDAAVGSHGHSILVVSLEPSSPDSLLRCSATPISGGAGILGPVSAGTRIGPGMSDWMPYSVAGGWFFHSYIHTTLHWDAWWGKRGFLPVALSLNGRIHYGWVEVAYDTDMYGSGYTLQFLGWAYQRRPGRTILAGQTR